MKKITSRIMFVLCVGALGLLNMGASSANEMIEAEQEQGQVETFIENYYSCIEQQEAFVREPLAMSAELLDYATIQVSVEKQVMQGTVPQTEVEAEIIDWFESENEIQAQVAIRVTNLYPGDRWNPEPRESGYGQIVTVHLLRSRDQGELLVKDLYSEDNYWDNYVRRLPEQKMLDANQSLDVPTERLATLDEIDPQMLAQKIQAYFDEHPEYSRQEVQRDLFQGANSDTSRIR